MRVQSAAQPAPELLSIVRKAAWRLMPVIMICYMFAFFDRINVSFAKFQLQADLGLSETAYGFGASLFSIGYVLFEVPGNMLLYKVGSRRWIARIMISWGIATSAMMLVTAEWQFYVLRFMIGAAEAGFAPGILYFLTLWFPAFYRGRVTSYMFVASACSGLIGGPLAGLILGGLDGTLGLRGWHWLFLAGGIPCIFLGVIVLYRLEDQISRVPWLSAGEKEVLSGVIASEKAEIRSGHSLWTAIRAPGFLMLGLIYFLIQICSYGLNFWAPHLIRVSGVKDPAWLGALTAVPYFCGALTMIIIGRYSDASGERRKYVALCLLAATAGFIIAGIFDNQPSALVFALAVTGAGIIASIPAFWPLPPKLLTGAGAAAGIALINTIGQLGGIVSPIMVGRITDVTGSTSPALYIIAGLCALGAVLVMGALPQTLRRIDLGAGARPANALSQEFPAGA